MSILFESLCSHLVKRIQVVVVLLLGPSQAYGFNVYSLGGTEGNPWSAALSFQPGEYTVVDAQGTVTDLGRVRSPSTYATWQETLTVTVDSLGGQWLRPFFVADTLNLAQDGVRERIQRGHFDNLTASSRCRDISAAVQRMRPMVDGDPNTAAFFLASGSEDPGIKMGIFAQNMILDLGADYLIHRVRFFPRLGRENPRLDRLLADMKPPVLDEEILAEADFSVNFLPWFEVAGASHSAGFPEECRPAVGRWTGIGWFLTIPWGRYGTEVNDSRFTILDRDTENLDVVVDIRFPVRPLQWIALRPLFPTRNWEIAEFQVFGQGYVPRAVFTSAVLDFGEPVVWGKIRWQGVRDDLAQVAIRTRSGTDSDPERYWQKTPVPGEWRELTHEDYERTPDYERRVTRDEEHWSLWSVPYPWEWGLRDPGQAAHGWEDGTPNLSPGPAQYLQVQIVFLSPPRAAGRLQTLEWQFSRPSAREVIGEIWPIEVERTARTPFTYKVLPTLFDGDRGFDRLEIFTLTRVDTVRSVKVDKWEVIDAFPPRILDDRIVVGFPRLQGDGDTAKLIEVAFDARVVLYGTEFQGWVFDSQANEVKQLITAGDADEAYPGNTLRVRTDPLDAALLTPVEVIPNPFTPNGDGINDQVHFHFQIHDVTSPRMLSVRVYDLAGGLVRQMTERSVVRGVFGEGAKEPMWDGLDSRGQRVPPGVYLYRIVLDTDTGREERVGTLSVVY